MFPFRGKNYLSGLWKPKNLHSLEYLKYLYNVLCKNQTVTEANRNLLVETLRLMSEILIWGDQNDSTVFDFFLEKNILSFFLRFMKQKYGRFICVQLLQTLNILFENIRNETSVYYLLSNNHINSIICHRFDFSDDEVMAYYISFLKTLSLKLNKHTIHFFYNEHTNDFALYTEAIKFFNHSESMVRIAVRTITLNVYKVDDRAMLRYIRDKTAAPYFINLVWFIGNHILEMNSCIRNDADHNSRGRLADLVAEHLDHLHYLNDILSLNIECLNEVMTDHLVNRLFIPLYVYSLTKRRKFSAATDARPHVSCAVSLFLLSQVFLIIHYPPLVRQLADIIFNGDLSVCSSEFTTCPDSSGRTLGSLGAIRREFAAPEEPLAQMLDNNRTRAPSPAKSDVSQRSEEILQHNSVEMLVDPSGIDQREGGGRSQKRSALEKRWAFVESDDEPSGDEMMLSRCCSVELDDDPISSRVNKISRERDSLEKRWAVVNHAGDGCYDDDDDDEEAYLQDVSELFREEEAAVVQWLHADGRHLRGLAVRVPSGVAESEEDLSSASFHAAWLHRRQRDTRGLGVRVPSHLEEKSAPVAEPAVLRRSGGRRTAREWRVVSK